MGMPLPHRTRHRRCSQEDHRVDSMYMKKPAEDVLPAGSDWVATSQKSNCPPILKNRDCSTLVGRSHADVAAFENVLFTEYGQLLLNTL